MLSTSRWLFIYIYIHINCRIIIITIWLFNSSPWKITMLLICKPSIYLWAIEIPWQTVSHNQRLILPPETWDPPVSPLFSPWFAPNFWRSLTCEMVASEAILWASQGGSSQLFQESTRWDQMGRWKSGLCFLSKTRKGHTNDSMTEENHGILICHW